MSLKNLLRTGLAALSLTLLPAIQAHAQTQGRDFSVVEPAVPTDSAGKIEVLEFFSYGCSHCADLYPVVKAWGAKKPGDVELRRVHVRASGDRRFQLRGVAAGDDHDVSCVMPALGKRKPDARSAAGNENGVAGGLHESSPLEWVLRRPEYPYTLQKKEGT